jgi:uncharacterized repeat protein (TIGR01451 family)
MNSAQRALALFGTILVALGWPASLAATDFATGKSYPVGTEPIVIVVGDFNGDGKKDLAVGNGGSTNVSLLINNGDGTLKAAVNSPLGASPESLVAGDFNGDGKLDLVVCNSTDGVFLLLGNGNGTFQAPVKIQADAAPSVLAVADLNEDNKLDLLVADGATGGLTLLLGKGDGTFQAGTVIFGDGAPVNAITLADFNGDKHLDVIVVVPFSGFNVVGLKLALLSGNGDGTFQQSVALAKIGRGTTEVSQRVLAPHLLTGDFNGDGKTDFALRYQLFAQDLPPCGINSPCPHFSTDTINLFSGNGDGTFSGSLNVFTAAGASLGNIAVGEFNADNKLDLLVERNEAGFLDLGKGDGTFLSLTQLQVWTALGHFAAAADLNGDTLSDVIVTDPANNAVVVFLNTSPTSGADLGVSVNPTHIDATIGAGDITYTAALLNTGPQDATGVVLKESLPAGLKFVSATPSQGTCTGTTTITCDLGAMADPSTASVNFTVTPISPGRLTDALHVTGTQPDLKSGNNATSLTVASILPADISVIGIASKTTTAIGDQVTYTVTVANAGPATATTLVLTGALSADFPISSLSTSQGSCATSPAAITCSLGTLASGGKATISLAITMQSGGIFVTNFSVTADQPDLNSGNNSSSQSVSVGPTDLAVTQTASATSVAIGTQVMFTLTVTNNGPHAANNVTLSDSLKAATFPAATPSQGSCAEPLGSGFNCALGSIAASATARVTFPATFLAVGQFANSVVVAADEPDTNSDNNSASVNITVTQTPDFSLAPANTTLTVTHGALASDVLTFTAQGGLASALALTCSVSGPAPLPPCSLNPASVTLAANPVTSTLRVDTSRLSAALVVAPTNAYGRGFYAMVLPLWLVIGAASRRNQKQRRRWLMSTGFLLAAILPAACGGGQQQTQFQTKTYTVTVQAKDGAGPTSHSTAITLTVQ